MRTIWLALGGCGIVLATASCDRVPGVSTLFSEGDADLVPLRTAELCGVGAVVTVTVRNQGAGNADASTTAVSFTRGGSFEIPTAAVNGGRIVTLSPLGIPAECFAPACAFQVTVDSGDRIDESDENNNTIDGSCPAPS